MTGRAAAALRERQPAAPPGPEDGPDHDQTGRLRTAEECLLKAAEQERRASGAPQGPIRDSFLEMAEDWRRLAAAAPPLVNLWR